MILELIGICMFNEVVKSVGNIGKSICDLADDFVEDYMCEDDDEMDFFEEDFDEDYYDD